MIGVDQRDRGAAGIEAPIAVMALLSVMFFVIGALRITNTSGDVTAAARAGARAAAAERTPASAQDAASVVAGSVLSDRGVACSGGPAVGLVGDPVAGGAVTVTVTCVVSLGDVVFGGFPGSRTVSGRGVEFVDGIRGGS